LTPALLRPRSGAVLTVGDPAPDFSALDQDGHRVTLDELVKDSHVVLYFYPKDFTPVCTAQACAFRDVEQELARGGLHVVGVSGDDHDSHRRFATQHRVPYRLLSDPDRTIQNAYGARQLLGFFAKRVTYVIDREKRIRGAFHHELSATKHIEAVRRIVQGIP